jgi:hypothetical protein
VTAPAGDTPKRRHGWWRWAVPLFTIGLATLTVEVILRSIPEETDPDIEGQYSMPDPIRGWVLRPNVQAMATGENTVWVTINGDGLRDREHTIAKPAGVFRVAVLGDSYMEALNLPFDKTFVPRLEAALTACAADGTRVEVINFAVHGYGTAQELLTFRHHARKYQPDVVLLAMFLNNDIYNNHRDLNPSTHDGTPYLEEGSGGWQFNFAAPPPEPVRPMYQRARLFVTDRLMTASLLYQGWGALRERFYPAPAVPPAPAALIHQFVLQDEIFKAPTHPATVGAWRATEELLRMFTDEVRESGAAPWIATLSIPQQTHPDVTVRAALAKRLGVQDLFYADRRVRTFMDGLHVPVISLAEPLAEYAAKNQVYLNGGYSKEYPAGDGHWNEVAHQIAASLVAERLCRASTAAAEP